MKILDDVVPVFGVSNKSTPRLVGTGFLVAHKDHHLIVTAAHVADEASKTPLLVPAENGVLRKIDAPAVKTLAPKRRPELR